MHILFLTQKAVLMPVIQYSAQKIFQMRNEPCIIYGLLVQLNLKGCLLYTSSVTFLGIPVTDVYYGSSVLPAILSIYLLSRVEMLLRKIIPGALRSIFVPFLSTLTVFPLLILAIGPIGVWGGNLFASLFTSMYDFLSLIHI